MEVYEIIMLDNIGNYDWLCSRYGRVISGCGYRTEQFGMDNANIVQQESSSTCVNTGGCRHKDKAFSAHCITGSIAYE